MEKPPPIYYDAPVTVFASFLDLKSLQFLAYLHDAHFLPSRELFAVFLPISRKESLNRSYFARAQDALSMTREKPNHLI